jgi:hypothetical protein
MDYKQTPTEKLYRQYANCCATAAGALGHSKTHYNEARALEIAQELQDRELPVPDRHIAARFGSFNGEGSY